MKTIEKKLLAIRLDIAKAKRSDLLTKDKILNKIDERCEDIQERLKKIYIPDIGNLFTTWHGVLLGIAHALQDDTRKRRGDARNICDEAMKQLARLKERYK